jgi:processive 1,2-diacylglycerol beta-glucosyltransferase
MMAAADISVGKAGGLSAAECLASGLPMVLTAPLPGQEEAVARRLLALGAALDGGSPEAAGALAARLLERPDEAAGARAAARRAGRPAAAANAANAVLDFLGLSRRGGHAPHERA